MRIEDLAKFENWNDKRIAAERAVIRAAKATKQIFTRASHRPWRYADGEVIAAARNALPALLREVELLREALERVLVGKPLGNEVMLLRHMLPDRKLGETP